MCSIMCYVGTLTEKESEAFLPKFTEGFEKTKSRGPDMSEVLQFGSGVCAFHRLAIMDLDETGMQPFCLDGSYSICNGELYGFRKMKRDLEAKVMPSLPTATVRSSSLCIASMALKCLPC
mgnify:CR=1 FL=1